MNLKKLIILNILWGAAIFIIFSCEKERVANPAYLDKNLPVNKRVDDLMERMTLEEKIGQMCQYVAIEHIKKSKMKLKGGELIEDDQFGMYPGLGTDDLKELVKTGKIGSFLHVLSTQEANELQRLALQSRLKIPLLLGIDAIHGHGLISGTTIYPTQLSLSCSWDDDLLFRVAKATAAEVRATGMHWTFSPNVDVARDARWGRCGETFGEDPFLVSRLGVAFTKGYQGDLGDENILACAKHFIAGSQPLNGTNASPMDVSELQLRNIWLPPYKAQVESGVYTFMAAHNELNGIPCHGNPWLLNDILRGEWGFDGFVVSDWLDIERLAILHHVVENQKEAVELAVNSGMDMHMHGPDFLEPLTQLVKEGKVNEDRISESCRSILKAKFMLGFFENLLVNEEDIKGKLFTHAHQELALEAARKSIVLLKNERNILPVKNAKRILVTGPNANTHRILGDWTHEQPEDKVTTIFEGMRQVFEESTVDYIDSGELLKSPSVEKLKKAVNAVDNYDLVIVAVGSNSLRIEADDKTCGENTDRARINLIGNQLELVQSIYKKNKNIVVVFVNGRPLAESWIKDNIPGIIEAFEPGSKGGQAIAEIIKGEVNPSGKLTMTFPRSVGQIVYTYNHKPSNFFRKYIDEPVEPLWPFGFGLGYSPVQYSNLTIKNTLLDKGENLECTFSLRNSGEMNSEEIVQVYIHDLVSSVTRPVKELKAYKRIALSAGETKQVNISIPFSDLGSYNAKMEYVVESGRFELMVGPSSNDSDLMKQPFEVL